MKKERLIMLHPFKFKFGKSSKKRSIELGGTVAEWSKVLLVKDKMN